MRHSLVSLTGHALRFDRAGRRLLSIEADRITVRDLASGALRDRATHLPIAGARAVVGFEDQLWIVTEAGQLARVDAQGHSLAAPTALPFTEHATLVAAPCGAPTAVWSTEVVLADAGASVLCKRVLADVAIPLTSTRLALASGSSVKLPSGVTVALAPTSTVRGGCVTADGKLLAMVVSHPAGRMLVIVSIAAGAIAWQGAIGATEAVAVGAAAAVIQVGPRELRVIDLRKCRETARRTVDTDIAALALDPSGHLLATRSPAGAITVQPLEAPAPEVEAATVLRRMPSASEPPPVEKDLPLFEAPTDQPLVAFVPPAPVAEVIAENIATIPRMQPPTTIDWISGGADHQKGTY